MAGQVEAFYDRSPDYEWHRLERHRMEFAVTMQALLDFLPPPPAAILDIGGGPGRYAIALTRHGYRVTLFDLSANNLTFAAEQARLAGVSLAGFEHGTATDLSRFQADRFDAVLLMGPLYHLLESAERQQAVREALRVLQPGGPLAASFIARYAPLRDAAIKDIDWILRDPEEHERILATGVYQAGPDRTGSLQRFLRNVIRTGARISITPRIAPIPCVKPPDYSLSPTIFYSRGQWPNNLHRSGMQSHPFWRKRSG